MLNDTATVTANEADFAIENFQVADADLPEFKDMKFENINELHLDHPGANDPQYRSPRRDSGLRTQFQDDGRDLRR